jgi:hypothetical protein
VWAPGVDTGQRRSLSRWGAGSQNDLGKELARALRKDVRGFSTEPHLVSVTSMPVPLLRPPGYLVIINITFPPDCHIYKDISMYLRKRRPLLSRSLALSRSLSLSLSRSLALGVMLGIKCSTIELHPRLLVLPDRLLLCGPGWPRTRDPPASSPGVLGLQV